MPIQGSGVARNRWLLVESYS